MRVHPQFCLSSLPRDGFGRSEGSDPRAVAQRLWLLPPQERTGCPKSPRLSHLNLGPLTFVLPRRGRCQPTTTGRPIRGTKRRATIPRCRRCTPTPTPCRTIQTTRLPSIHRRPLRTGPSRSIATGAGLRPSTRLTASRASTRQRRQRPIAPAAAGRCRIAGACRKTSVRDFTVSSRLARGQTSASSFSTIFLSCGRQMRREGRKFWSSCPQARGRRTMISEAPTTISAWPDRSGTSPPRCFPWSGRGRGASSGCRPARRASARIPFRNSAMLRAIRRRNGPMRTVSGSITPPPAGRNSIGTSWCGRRRRATNSTSSRRRTCIIGQQRSTPIPA